MKDVLLAFDERYLKAGIRPEFDGLLNRRLWVTNVFGLALGATVANYIWIFWLAELPTLALLCIPISLFYLLLPAMNRRGFVNFTRISFSLVAHGVILLYSLALGPDANIHLLFLLAASYAFLFFLAEERIQRWVSICFNVSCLLAFIAYFELGGAALFPLTDYSNNVISRMLFLTTLFLISLVTYFFFFASNEADARLKEHLQEMESIVAERTEELTRLNKVLKDSEEVLRATYESMKEGVLVVAEDGRVSHYNKRFTQIWSLPEDVLKRGVDAELVSHARNQLVDPEAFENRVTQIYQTDELLEDELRFKDGRIVNRTSCPLIKDGKQAGRAWFFDDITSKKRMEEMLVQAEKMGSLGGLAAGMAHEINNPLAGIMQNAEVAKRRLTENIPANVAVADQLGINIEDLHRYVEQRKIHPLLDNIREAGDRAARIVRNMLAFSRKSAGQFEPYPIAQLIEDTIELASSEYNLEKSYDFRQIAIHRNFDAQVPDVVCQKAKLQQVFLNLLKNAAHAVAEGRVQAPRIEITTELQQKMVHVVFKDNGPGFDEAVRRRVFEPFFTTKDVGEGTGLGLSVSYFIVTEDHGGQMMVESEKGQGTKFTVVLPVVQPKRAVV